MTRVMLPLAVLLATAALILYAARDLIRPATEVTTTRAIAVSITSSDTTGTPQVNRNTSSVVAQAPGWVEPDPYPVYASGLANGVVESVHVLEGETVKAGQLLVKLVDEDAQIALEQARAQVALAEAALTAAQTELDEPIALLRAEAVAGAQVEAEHAALIRLDAEIARDEARLDELNAAYERLAKLDKQSVSELKVDEAKYRAQSQRAIVEATRQRRPELEAMLETAKAEYAAAKRDLELKTQHKRTRDETRATLDSAQASLEEAQLRLERMTIFSPVDGVVMARLVSPGSKLMLDMDSPYSAHTIHLYDPEELQVRVDVPLADAAKVGLGQHAQIIVDVLPDISFSGKVTRLVHQADIAKNTVQFKVAIAAPSNLLKPDMLARVKFFSGKEATTTSPSDASAPSSSPVAIKTSAVIEQDGEQFVWWISPVDQRIERRSVALGQPRTNGTILITRGLNPGDLIIDAPAADLQENQRVHSGGHRQESR